MPLYSFSRQRVKSLLICFLDDADEVSFECVRPSALRPWGSKAFDDYSASAGREELAGDKKLQARFNHAVRLAQRFHAALTNKGDAQIAAELAEVSYLRCCVECTDYTSAAF
jgi:predicted HicB family RNase H-like nuclease